MAFLVAFTVTQSIDGATVTISDTSNYGTGGSFNKADMVSRTLYITRGDTLLTTTIDFPYTNTTNSIIDTYSFTEDQDYVYSIRMVLTDNVAVEYTATNQVITTEYTLKKLRTILSEEGCGCNCNNNCALVQQIQCGLDAASARTCAADISGAQQILSQINEVADNHINCC
jgi:hypothetical protein